MLAFILTAFVTVFSAVYLCAFMIAHTAFNGEFGEFIVLEKFLNNPLLLLAAIFALGISSYINGIYAAKDRVNCRINRANYALDKRQQELVELVVLAKKIVNKDAVTIVNQFVERTKKENDLVEK